MKNILFTLILLLTGCAGFKPGTISEEEKQRRESIAYIHKIKVNSFIYFTTPYVEVPFEIKVSRNTDYVKIKLYFHYSRPYNMNSLNNLIYESFDIQMRDKYTGKKYNAIKEKFQVSIPGIYILDVEAWNNKGDRSHRTERFEVIPSLFYYMY